MQLAVLILVLAVLLCVIAILFRGTGSPDQKLARNIEEIRNEQGRHGQVLREEFANNRSEYNANSRQIREEVTNLFAQLSTAIQTTLNNGLDGQRKQLEVFNSQLTGLTALVETKLTSVGSAIDERLAIVITDVKSSGADLRTELTAGFRGFSDDASSRISQGLDFQKQQLDANGAAVSQRLTDLGETIRNAIAELRAAVDGRLVAIQNENSTKIAQIQGDVADKLSTATTTLTNAVEQLGRATREQSEALRSQVEAKLASIQADNTAKLEHIRVTVDEKLHSTLEQRLGESFKLVSERLEQVHAGLGEMKALATGVGDLKKVLSNIKTRGTLGEVQLGNLLEQMFTPEQYGKNVQINPDSGERVEFAIKLPGRDGQGGSVWLPIDAKFPLSDYERLIDASDRGDPDGVSAASKDLEDTVMAQAKKIRTKYVSPPHSTDFGILFLATEGLFAEVLRRPGLCDKVFAEKVAIAGPTTLAALLTSLQMGFRTLAIEKHSAEVWNVLGAVKTEFSKFGDALNQVEKKLQEASNKIGDVHTRSRVLHRKLRAVHELPETESADVLKLEPIVIAASAEDDEVDEVAEVDSTED